MVSFTIYFMKEQLINMSKRKKGEVVAIRKATIELVADNGYSEKINEDNKRNRKDVSKIPISIFIKKSS